MSYYPFMMPYPQQQNNNTIEDIEKTMKFLDGLRKAQEDKDKEKKKEPLKKSGDILSTAMFFTFAAPFVMLIYGWIMTSMLLGVLEALAKIKGLH